MNIHKFNRFDPAQVMFFYAPVDDGGGDANSGKGNDSGGNANNPNPNPNTESSDQRDARILAEVQRKFDSQSARHNGDLTAALLDQIRKTHAAENGRKTAEQTADELRKQLPDDATKKRLSELDALGTPETIATAIQRAKRADELEREQTVCAACALAGIDYNDLSTRKGVDDWKFEIKTEERDGQSVKVPYATFTEGDKEQSAPLLEHAIKTFPTLARSQSDEGNRGDSQTQRVSGNGAWVNQDAGAKGGASQQVTQIIKPASYSM